jgi:hypothetical protein
MKAGKKGSPWLAVVAWGLVLAVGGLARAADDGAAGQDVNWAEPNDAMLFSAGWTYATLSSMLYNPAEDPDLAAKGTTRTLSVAGYVNINTAGKVLGTILTASDVKAVTETGAELTGSRHMSSSWRSYSDFGIVHGQASTSLDFPMDPNRGYPVLLKEVSWSLCALMYQQERWIDVPFQVTGQWVQLVPGIKVQFSQAVSQDGVYRYQFGGQYEGPGNPFNNHVSVHEYSPLPWYVVTKMQLLDAKGLPVKPETGSSSMSGSAGTAACSGNGECDTCGGVKTVRFWVVTGLYEIKLPFVVTDVPVPTL